MPKQKTHKSAAKRITKRTKSGDYIALAVSAQHRTRGKSSRVLRRSGKSQTLGSTEHKRLAKLLPYL